MIISDRKNFCSDNFHIFTKSFSKNILTFLLHYYGYCCYIDWSLYLWLIFEFWHFVHLFFVLDYLLRWLRTCIEQYESLIKAYLTAILICIKFFCNSILYQHIIHNSFNHHFLNKLLYVMDGSLLCQIIWNSKKKLFSTSVLLFTVMENFVIYFWFKVYVNSHRMEWLLSYVWLNSDFYFPSGQIKQYNHLFLKWINDRFFV